MLLAFKNGLKNIQTAGYNGACTVLFFAFEIVPFLAQNAATQKFHSIQI